MHQVLILDTGKQTDGGRLYGRRSAVNRGNSRRVEARNLTAVAGGVTLERSGRRVESADEMADIVVIANFARDVRSQTVKGRRVPPLRSGILVTQEAYWPPRRARRLPRLESLPSLAGISSRSVLLSLRRLAKALEYASPTLLEKDKALSVGADWAFAFVGSTTWHCHGDKRRQS